MPSLDRVLERRHTEQDAPLVQGELVMRKGAPYARVNGAAALWGPLRAAGDAEEGAEVLVAVSQTGDYWVVAHG